MVIQFVAFIGITAMVKISFKSDPNVFFFATLALVVVSAACTSFFQGGLFGLTAMMPFKYTQALMGGQGLGGVTVSLYVECLQFLFCGLQFASTQPLLWISLSIFLLLCC